MVLKSKSHDTNFVSVIPMSSKVYKITHIGCGEVAARFIWGDSDYILYSDCEGAQSNTDVITCDYCGTLIHAVNLNPQFIEADNNGKIS